MNSTQTAKRIQMHRTHAIGGVQVSFSRSIIGWVATFGGPDRFVHFRQPIKNGVWTAKKPYALEPLAIGPTLADVVLKCQAHYAADDKRIQDRIARAFAAIGR